MRWFMNIRRYKKPWRSSGGFQNVERLVHNIDTLLTLNADVFLLLLYDQKDANSYRYRNG